MKLENESKIAKKMKNKNIETKKPNNYSNSMNKKDKPLPWWVEFLFVQIGLPDKFLISILKTNKYLRELVKNEKKFLLKFLLFLLFLTYLYPVVKQSKNKLECEAIAKSYILKNKKSNKINKKNLRVVSTNFCNGGNQIIEIEDFK